MSVWVVNASPLILLGKFDQLPLLAKLAGQVVIPHEVAIEINAGPLGDPARCWLESEGRSFVAKPRPFDLRVVAWDLGHGETAVISRALSEPDAVCLLDDRAARDCAQLFGGTGQRNGRYIAARKKSRLDSSGSVRARRPASLRSFVERCGDPRGAPIGRRELRTDIGRQFPASKRTNLT